MDYRSEYAAAKSLVEARLESLLTAPGLEEAMRYSLLAGGKRVRPVLTLSFCKAAGGRPEAALSFACGVEMLHTYSLIHDDLPAMDNDDLRRGMPTSHKKFGECTAILAGDALQAAAFRTVVSAEGPWRSEGTPAPLTAARLLAEAAGERGMCLGQYHDTMENGGLHTAEELTRINDLKTGALLRAACMMGVAAACLDREEEEACMTAARDYATALGLAFQIRDDMLDATSTTQELGKPVGSDEENRKCTYVSLLGVEACGKLVRDYTDRAKAALLRVPWRGGTAFLLALADELAERNT